MGMNEVYCLLKNKCRVSGEMNTSSFHNNNNPKKNILDISGFLRESVLVPVILHFPVFTPHSTLPFRRSL